MELNDIYKPIEEELREVEEYLEKAVNTSSGIVSDAASHLLKAGGKRMRPALVLFASKVRNGLKDEDNKTYVEFAAMVEILHMATLMHDDIVDGSRVRRRMPTVHAKFGVRTAVLAGDYLYAKIIPVLLSKEDEDKQRLKIIEVLAGVVVSMCQGAAREIDDGDALDKKYNDYFLLIEEKTAEFLAGCCSIGAIAAKLPLSHKSALSAYGNDLGMAFQITDDILDVCAEDISLEETSNLPLLYTYTAASGTDKSIIEKLLSNSRNCSSLEQIIKKYNGIEYARNKAFEYSESAKRRLDIFEDSVSKASLAALCDYVVNRDK